MDSLKKRIYEEARESINGESRSKKEAVISEIVKKILEFPKEKIIESFGADFYLDYKNYEEKIYGGEYAEFLSLFDFKFPYNKKLNLPKHKKIAIMRGMAQVNDENKKDFIVSKLAQDYFPVEDFEKYLESKEKLKELGL